MTAGRSGRCNGLFGMAAVFASMGAAAWMLLKFPPEQYGFYPACPIREYLHIECPGCGATRAVAALLQGRLADALRLNALVIAVVLPLAMLYAGVVFARYSRNDEFRWPSVPVLAIYAMLGTAAAFSLVRNL